MQDYKPNSHRFKEEQKAAQSEKRVQKVVNGKTRTKQKSGLSKVAGVFISDDVHNVGDYLLHDIAIPTLKKAALSTLDMILNGGTPTYTANNRSSTSKVSYRQYYDDPRDSHRASSNPRTRFDFNTIEFETRGEAEAVREAMFDTIETYGFVTVADMYDMAGLNQPFTSNKYGWTNIRNSEVVRQLGGGYIIKLPKAMPID